MFSVNPADSLHPEWLTLEHWKKAQDMYFGRLRALCASKGTTCVAAAECGNLCEVDPAGHVKSTTCVKISDWQLALEWTSAMWGPSAVDKQLRTCMLKMFGRAQTFDFGIEFDLLAEEPAINPTGDDPTLYPWEGVARTLYTSTIVASAKSYIEQSGMLQELVAYHTKNNMQTAYGTIGEAYFNNLPNQLQRMQTDPVC
jgi:hypothetical protein